MNTPKWIPKHSEEILKLFEESRFLERNLRVLGNKYSTDINLNLPDYYVSVNECHVHMNTIVCCIVTI